MSDIDYDKLPDNFRKFKKEYINAHPELKKKKEPIASNF